VKVRGKNIGPGTPTFVIAEAGSNHNGSIETAHQLIDVAAAAKADAVKFQTFKAQRLYPKSAGTSDYLGLDTPIYDIIEAMEMPSEWLPELRDHTHDSGLAFISTPFHEEAVALLDAYVDAFKIASYEMTHDPLLREVAACGKPIFISTGAADLDEARHAVEVLRDAGCDEPVVLQCTAAYPAPPDAANVRALVTMREELGVMTGLSDHTRDPTAAPMAAVALGAVAIEKHFTLDNSLPGPDHSYAVEPDELARLVSGIRRVEAVLGSGKKEVLASEEELHSFARRSIFTTRDITAGEPFSRANIDVLRAGKLGAGLAPSELERVLAAIAAEDISAESPLQEAHLTTIDH
jgi:N-acetylneuraminate synthase